MRVLLFMGEVPEFYTCQVCEIAFDLVDLKPLAKVLGVGEPNVPSSSSNTHSRKDKPVTH